MKIVDRKTFLALPPGVLYFKICGSVFESLCIKCETLGNDWVYLPLDSFETDEGESYLSGVARRIETDSLKHDIEGTCRDGCFNFEEKFAVMQREEVVALIQRFQLALVEGYRDPRMDTEQPTR